MKKTHKHQKEILRTNLAGVQYSDYQLVVGLKAGRKLKLFHEPSNVYDKRAIKVCCDGVKIGYIPAKLTANLHNLHARGGKLTAEVAAFNKTNPTWSMICVKIILLNKPRSVVSSYYKEKTWLDFNDFESEFADEIDF